ncbi:unnamed protein product, partial [Meganyctiphanes norvegica]
PYVMTKTTKIVIICSSGTICIGILMLGMFFAFRRYQASRKCTLCQMFITKEKYIKLLPCNHKRTCNVCMRRKTLCPVCSQPFDVCCVICKKPIPEEERITLTPCKHYQTCEICVRPRLTKKICPVCCKPFEGIK